MTSKEVKEILAQKLHEEGTCFTPSDISVTTRKKNGQVEGFKIVIKGYEPFVFNIQMVNNDVFDKELAVWEKYKGEGDLIGLFSKKNNDYDWLCAILNLGYHIGNTF